ncbi:hypothetical protein D1610_00605 [Sphingomonas gilva]|uniref:Uncharacterized protein n=1 Tax=Sphingomonas gilva TaxID=2305907 RepID=A0A396RRQ0_9SPHN|nr:hypothetical protein [Sphingomonas gilva]RHW18706.1 hypothetical protein D1610_00605 [Sphingomonas gilva]
MGEGVRYCQGARGAAQRIAMEAKDERTKRLAEALRANLRRRKAQARDGAEPVADGEKPEPKTR